VQGKSRMERCLWLGKVKLRNVRSSHAVLHSRCSPESSVFFRGPGRRVVLQCHLFRTAVCRSGHPFAVK
jgi:hypothetical protein